MRLSYVIQNICFLAFLAIISANQVSAEFDAERLELAGRYPYGYCTTTFSYGDYLCIGNGTVMEILDKSSLLPVGEYVTESIVNSIFVDSTFAYVANWSDGIKVIDISDVTTPVQVAAIPFEGQCWNISVYDDFAYVGNDILGLRIIDVSNPHDINLAGTFLPDEESGFEQTVVIENIAYAASKTGLYILDVSDKSNPTLLSYSPSPNGSWHVTVDESIAYLPEAYGLRMLDVSNPENPIDRGYYFTAAPAQDLEVNDNTAYVSVGGSGLEIIDLTTPDQPTSIGLYGDFYAQALHRSGDTLYVGNSGSGVTAVDISNRLNLSTIGSHSAGGYTRQVYSFGDYHYVISIGEGLAVINATNIQNPVREMMIPLLNPSAVHGYGEYLYVSDFNGVHIYSVLNPAEPEFISNIPLGNTRSMVSSESLLYLGGDPDLTIVDVSDNFNPMILGNYDGLPGSPYNIDIQGTGVFLANRYGGLWIIDASNPLAPSPYPVSIDMDFAWDVSVSGDIAYVADRFEGMLRVINVADPASPFEMAAFPIGSSTGLIGVDMYANAVVGVGNYAFVLTNWDGLKIINCYDPTSPFEIGHFNTGGYAQNIDIQGTDICVTDGGGGIYFLEVDAEPELVVIPSDTLDFGTTYIGYPDTMEIVVFNGGFGPNLLTLDQITLVGDGFSAPLESFSLGSGETQIIPVILNPTLVQEYVATLTFSSNDATIEDVTRVLIGDGKYEPDIDLIPDSLSIAVYPGAISTHIINIDNSFGQSTLLWQAYLAESDEGAVVDFSKADYADWTLAENQDRITSNVWITRANSQGLFNIAVEPEHDRDSSPYDTEWSFGYTEELSPEDYQPWRDAVNANPPSMIDQPISMHIISEDIYFDIIFNSWSSGGSGGGFSYSRSTTMVDWISISPENGSVGANQNMDISLITDASGLAAGDYEATIVIASNDPDESAIEFPVHMEVLSGSDISVEIDTLDFGTVYVNYSDTLELEVWNLGGEALNINDASIDVEEFQISPASMQMAAGESGIFEVWSNTPTSGQFYGALTFTSTDPDEETLLVTLAATALEPPVAMVTPDSLSAGLFTGESLIHTMTIHNSGASDLMYEIRGVLADPDLTRNLFPTEIAPNTPRYSLRELLDLGESSSHESNERPGKRFPRKPSERQSNFALNSLRESWQLLYTDTVDPELDVDVHHVYGMLTSSELLFKVESYDPWDEADFNTVGIVYIDIDQDLSTGAIEDEDFYWEIGIDLAILSTGGLTEDGIYLWDENEGDFVWIEDLTSRLANDNSSEFSFGVNSVYFENERAINFGMLAGSINSEPDILPEEGIITYNLSPGWLGFDIESGTLLSATQQEISVTFDASELYGGDYYADIQVISNDPATPIVEIPAHLIVTGYPGITPGTDNLDFGIVYIGYESVIELELFSTGTDVLTINNIISDNPAFTVISFPTSITYYEFGTVVVAINATEEIEHFGNLLISSNDADQQEISVTIHATALVAPELHLDPDIVHVEIEINQEVRDTLIISNQGGSDLEYNISVQQLGLFREEGGPDEYGYRWTDSDTPAGPQYEWVDASIGTSINLGDDDYISDIPIEFDFEYYGDSYNSIHVMSNGWVSFTSMDFWAPDQVPFYDPFSYGGAIAPFGGDLLPEVGSISYLTQGVAPARRFIVEYNHISWCCSGPPYMTFQVVLYESNNRIRFQYQSLEGQTPWAMGIANYDNSTGLGNGGVAETFIDPAIIRDEYAIEFSAQPDWLVVEPAGGIIAAGMNESIMLDFSSAGLEAGEYMAYLGIASNDPAMNQANIPVTMVISTVGVETETLPESYVLDQNFPNPFNPTTKIRYGLPEAADLSVIIYDILGRETVRLVETPQEAGWYQIQWDGTDAQGKLANTGIYFCRMVTEDYSRTIKLVYLR